MASNLPDFNMEIFSSSCLSLNLITIAAIVAATPRRRDRDAYTLIRSLDIIITIPVCLRSPYRHSAYWVYNYFSLYSTGGFQCMPRENRRGVIRFKLVMIVQPPLTEFSGLASLARFSWFTHVPTIYRESVAHSGPSLSLSTLRDSSC